MLNTIDIATLESKQISALDPELYRLIVNGRQPPKGDFRPLTLSPIDFHILVPSSVESDSEWA